LVISYLPEDALQVNSQVKLRPIDLFSSIKNSSKYIPKTHLFLAGDSASDLHEINVVNIPEDSIWIDYSIGKKNQLFDFFIKLSDKERKKKVRIAYFGDSMIEGDLIVKDFRNLLQQKYGGKGVGMVPVVSITAGFRQTIKHQFSTDWEEFNLLLKNSSFAPGITGHVFIPKIAPAVDSLNPPKEASWCAFQPTSDAHNNEFNNTSVLFGPSGLHNYVFVKNQKGISKSLALTGSKPVNKLEVPQTIAKNGLTLSFSMQEKVPIYALNFDGDSGIYVDNFSFRGNSGMPLTRIPYSILNATNEQEPYDLIILQYGLNAASAEVKDYHWYQAGLNQMVNHIKRCFPNAAILMITPGDKSYKENGEWITDPGLLRVIETEKKVAKANQIAFYNFFVAMGGNNSMVEWAEGSPPKANKDYTHFNFRGAAIAGKMIFNAIENAKEEFEKENEITKSTKLPSLQ
jgi:lysophospholipase L1-like esterase